MSEEKTLRFAQKTLIAGVGTSAVLFLFGLAFSDKLIRAGVWVLALTPVARVAVLGWGYAKLKEYRIAACALVVLIMIFSGFWAAQ